MAIYAIADLHLSFNTDKPMNIFGWIDYEEKIKKDWLEKVKEEDLVLLPGDFSWELKLENAYKDFNFINELPGKKLMLKGNHDLWWTTLKSMRNYLEVNNIKDVDFIYNNSYEYENYIIAGTRGWDLECKNEQDEKIKNREVFRLENSILDGIKKYGEDKEIIVCMHYPPLEKENLNTEFTKVMKKYNVTKCIYGHLHGKAHESAVEGMINGIEYKLVSCDYTKFQLIRL